MVDAARGTALAGDGGAGPAGGAGPIPAGGPQDAVSDATAAYGQRPAAQQGVVRPAARTASGRMADWVEPLVLLALGLGLISGVSLLRARQRQRLGWGVLPDRS